MNSVDDTCAEFDALQLDADDWLDLGEQTPWSAFHMGCECHNYRIVKMLLQKYHTIWSCDPLCLSWFMKRIKQMDLFLARIMLEVGWSFNCRASPLYDLCSTPSVLFESDQEKFEMIELWTDFGVIDQYQWEHRYSVNSCVWQLLEQFNGVDIIPDWVVQVCQMWLDFDLNFHYTPIEKRDHNTLESYLRSKIIVQHQMQYQPIQDLCNTDQERYSVRLSSVASTLNDFLVGDVINLVVNYASRLPWFLYLKRK